MPGPLSVPTVGAEVGGTPQYGGSGVQPFRNAAPEQLRELGMAEERAGGTLSFLGNTIGDRVRAVSDEANTKAAETAFIKQSNTILYDPENGYFNRLGKAAVDQYQPTAEAISKAGQEGLDSLSNPLQKQMFNQVLQSHLANISKQMAVYNHGQGVAWAASESKARSESLGIQALQSMDSRYQRDADGNLSGEFAKNLGAMDAEVIHASQLAGFDADSAQTKANIRESRTALNHAMIAKMLDNHDAHGAQQWFDEQSAAGNIDLRNSEQLGGAIKAEVDRQTVEEASDKYVNAALTDNKAPVTLAMPVPGSSINVTSGLGAPRDGGRSHDGIDIAVPVGTQVMAPADGKVTKVWTDDKFGGGLSMEVTFPNGYTAGFAHLSAANFREGDKVQQGTVVGLSGKTGNATGPVLHYMMKDADGNYVDPRQVSQPQPDKSGIADPDALEKAIKLAQQGDEAPQIKKRIIANLETMHGNYRSMQNQQYEDLKSTAMDYWYKNGGNVAAIPGSIRSQLKAKDLYEFSQGLPKKDDTEVQAQFILDPKAQTVAWVQSHRASFTDGTYLSNLRYAQGLEQSADKEKAASLDSNQMDDILIRNGFTNLVNPKQSDKEDYANAVALKSTIMDRFTSEQNNSKTPLTRERKSEIITGVIRDTVSSHNTFWSDKTNIPAFELGSGLPLADRAQNAYVTVGNKRVKLAAIPAEDQRQITDALQRSGQAVTQQAIAEMWVKARARQGQSVPSF